MTDNEAYRLARQYFAGQISREGEKKLYLYLRQDEAKLALFRQWEEEWETAHEDSESAREAWRRLTEALRSEDKPRTDHDNSETKPKARIYGLYRRVAAVAAIFILAFGAGLLAMKVLNDRPERYYALTAPMGSTSRFEMADGTVVWLNAGTTLRYSDRFGSDNRRVALDGEAYFEVARHEGKEFTVSTKGYDVVVKGTHFDVSAYNDDPDITTSLMQGHVVIERGDKTLDMRPGDQVSLDKHTGKFTATRMSGDVSAWKTDMVDYSSITLVDLAKRLSRQYNVSIDVHGQRLRQTRVSITLNNVLTIDEVMDALRNVTHAKVSRQGKNIVLR